MGTKSTKIIQQMMVCSPRPIQGLIKLAGTEVCEGVHTAQRQIPTQSYVPIELCTHFSDICVGLCLGVEQCECTIRPLCRLAEMSTEN